MQSDQQEASQTLAAETQGAAKSERASVQRLVQKEAWKEEGISWLPLLHPFRLQRT